MFARGVSKIFADPERFDLDRENDVLKAAQADILRANNGLSTLNEVRVDNGQEPIVDPTADQLGIKTAQGFIPIGQVMTMNGTLAIGEQAKNPAAVPGAKKRMLIERGDPTLIASAKVNGHA